MKKIGRMAIKYSLVIVSIISVAPWMSQMTFSPAILIWMFYAVLLYVTYQYKERLNYIFILWFVFVSIQALRGIGIAYDYYSYKNLIGNYLGLVQVLFCVIFMSPYNVRIAYKTWMFLIPIIFLFWVMPFGLTMVYYHLLGFVVLLLLFFRDFTFRYKLILLAIVIISFDLENRSHVIRVVAFLLIGFFYIKKLYWFRIYAKFIILLLFSLPIMLFLIGAVGHFDVFNFDKYINVKAEGSMGTSITADTRTFLYEEVILSSIARDNVFFGGSTAGGYKSSFDEGIQELLNNNKAERSNLEVGILGVYLWTGITGVILYSLIFVSVCFYALKHSRNKYIIRIAIALAFMWAYSWVENMITPHTTNIMVAIMMGMCLSKDFLNMSNLEFKRFLYSIFLKSKVSHTKLNVRYRF